MKIDDDRFCEGIRLFAITPHTLEEQKRVGEY